MGNQNAWTLQDKQLQLTGDEVHIWLVNIDDEERYLVYLSSILSQGELERGNRFHFEKDRKRQIIARGMLRLILNRYIQIEPEAIRFSVEKKGKPILDHMEYNHIKFNLSHSGKYILYAVAYNRAVGIDIEYIKDLTDSDQIVNRYFSKKEISEYFQLPAEIRKQAFFTCWTRKEAFIKAVGEGLYMPLSDFSVSPDPSKKSKIEIHTSGELSNSWSLKDIDVNDSDYKASLVIEGSVNQYHQYKMKMDFTR